MKLTAQEEYGLRCILSLARAEERTGSEIGSEIGSKSLTISDIADLEGISPQYAGKLIRILGKQGLVTSVRGCKGGYRLSRPPDGIRVAEVLDALGSKVYDPQLCDRFRGDRPFCVHTNDCSIRSLWSGVQLVIDAVLSKTTLKELVANERTVAEWLQVHLATMASLGSEALESVGSALGVHVASVEVANLTREHAEPT